MVVKGVNMQTFETIQSILSEVKYKDWEFRVKSKGDGWTLQIIFFAPDNDNPDPELLFEQHCRKYYLSPYMTKSEIVRTAFLAVRQAEEHEMCELFLYKGQRIFNPHVNMDDLVEMASKSQPDVRAHDSGQNTKSSIQ
jgi:hypothetical protein